MIGVSKEEEKIRAKIRDVYNSGHCDHVLIEILDLESGYALWLGTFLSRGGAVW